jgi:maltodextrin utilization protein YvdJ
MGFAGIAALFLSLNLSGQQPGVVLAIPLQTGDMKSSIQVVFFFLLGLVASFAIPLPKSRAQFAIADFKEVCCLSPERSAKDCY